MNKAIKRATGKELELKLLELRVQRRFELMKVVLPEVMRLAPKTPGFRSENLVAKICAKVADALLEELDTTS